MPLILPHHYVVRHALLTASFAEGHIRPATFLYRGTANNTKAVGVRGWLRSDGKMSSWPLLTDMIRKLEARGFAFTNEGYYWQGRFTRCVDHSGNRIADLPKCENPSAWGTRSGGAIATRVASEGVAQHAPSNSHDDADCVNIEGDE